MDQPAADSLAASCADFVADGGPVEGLVTPILDSVEARKTTRCPAATAAYKSPAGSLFPRKLVLHLFTWRHGLNLQMRTPVRRVVPCTNNIGDTWESGVRAGGWRVETDCGAVETETVVYATNAYTATLLPEFVGHIWPFKGQCAAAVPPEAYVRPNMLRETYVLVRRPHPLTDADTDLYLLRQTDTQRLPHLAAHRRRDHIRRPAEERARRAAPREYGRQASGPGDGGGATGGAAAPL
jgi:hypothetical protein